MQERNKKAAPQQSGKQPKKKGHLLFVLVFVFIFCGGNGLGILTSAVILLKTGRKLLAIGILLGITLLALLLAILVAVAYFRSVARDAADPKEQTEVLEE